MIKNILVNRIFMFFICVIVVTSILSMTNVVKAESNSAGFHVSAELPNNQIDKNASYFDLKMKPSQKQTLKVKVFNNKDKDMNISIYSANASSNSNGIIEYTRQGIADKSLKHPFESISQLEKDIVTIPANSHKIVKIKLTMPKEEFDGIVLGGLIFKEDTEDQISSQKSLSINNVLSYALAVKLSENDNFENIHLNLTGVKAQVVDYEPVITHYIQNDAAALSTKMKLNISVSDIDTGKVVSTSENDNVSIAPNSVMPYSLKLKNAALEEGNYISRLSVTYKDNKGKDETVEFEKKFSVSAEHEKAANDYNSVQETTPLWAKVIIGGIGILVISIITLIIIIVLRKKKNVKNIKT